MRKSGAWKIMSIVAALGGLALVAAGCGDNAENNAGSSPAPAQTAAVASPSPEATAKNYNGLTLNLGIQPGPGPYSLAREKGWFEEEFAKDGIKVEWAEFQSGPPMTEAIAADRLDFAGLGNLPVVTAQAADIGFVEISQIIDGKTNVAIIVPADSAIAKIEELKGKKVAVAKGSNAFNFLYLGLDLAGLKPTDLEIIQLQPNEAQPAFETGGVDVWATWDPYITTNVLTGKGKVLTDGETLGVLSPSFLIARSKLAAEHPELITRFLKVYEQARVWETNNLDEAVKLYADKFQVDAAVIKTLRERSVPINLPISQEIIDQQQKTADFQFEQKTIRKQVDVSTVVNNSFIEQAIKDAAAEPK